MEMLEKTMDVVHSESREVFFEELYENAFPAFARFASNMNASFQDAKDIFHDALVIYYEKTMEEDFAIRTSAHAYIVGIAKHLWIRKYKKDRHKIPLDRVESEISIPPDYYAAGNELELLAFLGESGKKCLDLLRKFYYENKSLQNIAAALGYGSVRSATVQKFKCIGKLRDAIKEKNVDYEDFLH
jgi:DNA-directed RNA polymerase specialized sigma24 family protein